MYVERYCRWVPLLSCVGQFLGQIEVFPVYFMRVSLSVNYEQVLVKFRLLIRRLFDL